MKTKMILLLVMGLLMSTSCTGQWASHRLTSEDLRKMTQTFTVKPFEKVDVSNDYEVIYRQDSFYSVRAVGPSYFVKRLDVGSDGKTLFIRHKNGMPGGYTLGFKDVDTTVKVYVTSPDLISVKTSNSSSFEAKELIDTDNLSLALHNSSDIELGRVLCDNLTLNIYNSSDAEIKDLTTQNLKLNCYNASDVEIKSLDARKAELRGYNSSDINVRCRRCTQLYAEALNASSINVSGTVEHYTQKALNAGEVIIHH